MVSLTPLMSHLFLTPLNCSGASFGPTGKGPISPSAFMEQCCHAHTHQGEGAHSSLCTGRIYASICIKLRGLFDHLLRD